MKGSSVKVILAQTLEHNATSKKEEMEFVVNCYKEISGCQFKKVQLPDQSILYQCNKCDDFLVYSTSGDQCTLRDHHLQPLTKGASSGTQPQTHEGNSSFLKHFKREGQLKDFEFNHRYYVDNDGRNYEGFEMQSGNKKLWIEHCAVDDKCTANAVVLMNPRSYKFINCNMQHSHPNNSLANKWLPPTEEDFPFLN